ncbi:MAG: metallophosphoesterase, partial [Candidatus Competibacteraceae bacterium]|nr:metallophosphoesterase [Candidatus Competibacteraceae bacterium]
TRCIGHGAVPYGNTSELEDAPQVLWYEKENANDPAIPVRVLNGFAQLRLEGSDLIETLVDENGSVKWEHAPST